MGIDMDIKHPFTNILATLPLHHKARDAPGGRPTS
jgi:hypothetical protein